MLRYENVSASSSVLEKRYGWRVLLAIRAILIELVSAQEAMRSQALMTYAIQSKVNAKPSNSYDFRANHGF